MKVASRAADRVLGISVVPQKHSAATYTCAGRIAVPPDVQGPLSVTIVGQDRSHQADCREVTESTRATRRGKAAPRRLLQIEPLLVDLSAGPVAVVLHGGADGPQTLARLDVPGAAALRFRHLLALDLQAGLARIRTHSRAKRLSAQFDLLPPDLNDPAWLESAIVLSLLRRMRAPRTRHYLRVLLQRRTQAGEDAAHASFLRLLTQDHGLRLPGNHGYGQTLGEADSTAVWAGIAETCGVLRDLGLTVFINSGTLLGMVREGNLLAHDDDIDLAVVLEGSTQSQVARQWEDLATRLRGLRLLNTAVPRKAVTLKLRPICGFSVDLFPAWIDAKGHVCVYPHTKGELMRHDLLPLQDGPVAGVPLPRRPEKMLALNYGAEWRKPDPSFQFPWAAANLRFRGFMSALHKLQVPSA